MERPPATVRIEELLAHREWVRRMARALVQDDARADDLEQEVWTSALKRPPEGRGLPLRGWLATVMRFRAIDQRRGEDRRRAREESVARPEGEPSAVEVVARGEILKRVVTAVMDLEEPYRSTVLLRYFEDLPPAAVADRQGVPLETVRTRLRRALARLRERLDSGQDGGRRAWLSMLVPLARGTAPGPQESAAGGSALAAATGVLAMGVKTKVVVVAGILALTAGSLWRATREPVPAVPGPEPAGESSTASSRGRGAARPASEEQGGGHEATSDPSVPGEVALRGRVLDGSGRALVGAEVQAAGRTALTDADGNYQLTVSRPSAGPLTITARFWRFEPAEREIQVPATGSPPEEVFRLSPDLVVAGRVVDDEGAPIVGAQVRLDLPGSEQPWETATTDGDGRFSATRGEVGVFQLRVDAPAPPKTWRTAFQSVVVPSGNRDVLVVFRRRPQGRTALRAEVVDAATGSPCTSIRPLVVEATAGLTPPPGLRTSVVAPGLVTAEGLWPGRWRIWVEVPDHAPAMKEFQVVPDSVEVGVRVEVPLRGALVGRVEFGEVPPTELLYVHAVNRLSLSGAVPSWMDLTGRLPFGSVPREFEFQLAPGEYVVQAFGRGTRAEGIVATASALVRVEPGEKTNVTLRMGPVAQLRFQCGLVPGLVTELWMAEGDGEFEMRDRYVGGGIASFVQDVSPGTYRWRVRFLADDVVHDVREAARPLEGTVTVGAGESVILPRPADLKPR